MPYARTVSGLETCAFLCLDAARAEGIRRALPEPSVLAALAAGVKSYADVTRLTIALALREGGALCVCDVGFVVGRDEKLVSHHVRALKRAGLARSRREGRTVFYELTDVGHRLLEGLLGAEVEELAT